MVLLDASALLALLYDEPGAAAVHAQVMDASLLAINLEETLGVLVSGGMPLPVARKTLDTLGLTIVAYNEQMAWRSAAARPLLPAGLGVADRACLAAGAVLGLRVQTADALWREAAQPFGVEVELIR